MPRVAKNGTIRLGEGKGVIPFATWEDMDTALRPVMQRHGFSLSFDVQPELARRMGYEELGPLFRKAI